MWLGFTLLALLIVAGYYLVYRGLKEHHTRLFESFEPDIREILQAKSDGEAEFFTEEEAIVNYEEYLENELTPLGILKNKLK